MAWNGSNETGSSGGNSTAAKSKASKSPSMLRGLIAGVVVVAVAGVVAYFVLAPSAEKPVVKEVVKTPAKIAEQAPAVVTNAPAPAKKQVEKPVEMYKGVKVVSHTYTTNSTGLSVREIIVTADGKTHGRTTLLGKATFKNTTDALIADVLFPPMDRGAVPPLPPMDATALDKQFRASMKTPVEILPTDTEEVIAKKTAVMEARDEIIRLMDEKKYSFLDIINHERDAAQNARELRLEVMRTLQQVRAEGGTVADEIEILKAGNKLLEEKGVQPVEYTAPGNGRRPQKGSEE